MTPERWNRIQSLFVAMVELPPADRAARLREACNGDRRLCHEVELLLEADRAARDGWSIQEAVVRTLRELLE